MEWENIAVPSGYLISWKKALNLRRMSMRIDRYGEVISVQSEVERNGFTMSVHVFYIDGMLVDTGASRMLEDLKEFYEEVPIEFVSITHPHEDHTGTAAWLLREKSVPIYIRDTAIPQCRTEADIPAYREMIWGERAAFDPSPFGETIQSDHHTYKTIHTPGHEENHLALLDEENGRLFSGDLFIHPKPKVIMEDESVPVLMRSIRKVLEHDFEEMFCQHVGYIRYGKAALKKKLDYLNEVSEQVREMYKEGRTLEEMNNELFSDVPAIVPLSDYEYDSRHMIRTIIEDAAID
ncbi:MBL fold metallo-hydrolase [Salimicrobium sp. PL1-032A]|uniref:MBL fold metallo-hydrolase n=1 Tax=Salimicrobium sp. PL1-032A TaxID=3095364 RepID=UPI0032616BE9